MPVRILSRRHCACRHQPLPEHCTPSLEPATSKATAPTARAPSALVRYHSDCRVSTAVPWVSISQLSLLCPSAFFTLQLWFAPEVGPASDHGSDLVHQSEGSRPQSQLRSRPQHQLQSLRQSLRSLRDSDDTRLEWDPGPHHLCLSGDLEGPGPPSGPAHQARVSHPHPGLSRHLLHQL